MASLDLMIRSEKSRSAESTSKSVICCKPDVISFGSNVHPRQVSQILIFESDGMTAKRTWSTQS